MTCSMKVTVRYCGLRLEDIFFDSHKEMTEHCRLCGKCQYGKYAHTISNRSKYLKLYGAGRNQPKAVRII